MSKPAPTGCGLFGLAGTRSCARARPNQTWRNESPPHLRKQPPVLDRRPNLHSGCVLRLQADSVSRASFWRSIVSQLCPQRGRHGTPVHAPALSARREVTGARDARSGAASARSARVRPFSSGGGRPRPSSHLSRHRQMGEGCASHFTPPTGQETHRLGAEATPTRPTPRADSNINPLTRDCIMSAYDTKAQASRAHK